MPRVAVIDSEVEKLGMGGEKMPLQQFRSGPRQADVKPGQQRFRLAHDQSRSAATSFRGRQDIIKYSTPRVNECHVSLFFDSPQFCGQEGQTWSPKPPVYTIGYTILRYRNSIGGVALPGHESVPKTSLDETPVDRLDELVVKIYQELRQIARVHRSGERGNLTLQTTALVHEAYLRLASSDDSHSLKDRQHLKALTSRIIRHVLVDYARRTRAGKRDAANAPPGRIEETLIEPKLDLNVLDLDAALHRLARHAPRLEKIVECRFFGGMNVKQTAEALDLSTRTVERDWRKAKTYLLRYLDDPKSGGGSG